MTTETTQAADNILDVTITMADEPTGRDDRGHSLFDYILTCARNGEIDRGPFDEAEAERRAQAHIDNGQYGWDRGEVIWDV